MSILQHHKLKRLFLGLRAFVRQAKATRVFVERRLDREKAQAKTLVWKILKKRWGVHRLFRRWYLGVLRKCFGGLRALQHIQQAKNYLFGRVVRGLLEPRLRRAWRLLKAVGFRKYQLKLRAFGGISRNRQRAVATNKATKEAGSRLLRSQFHKWNRAWGNRKASQHLDLLLSRLLCRKYFGVLRSVLFFGRAILRTENILCLRQKKLALDRLSQVSDLKRKIYLFQQRKCVRFNRKSFMIFRAHLYLQRTRKAAVAQGLGRLGHWVTRRELQEGLTALTEEFVATKFREFHLKKLKRKIWRDFARTVRGLVEQKLRFQRGQFLKKLQVATAKSLLIASRKTEELRLKRLRRSFLSFWCEVRVKRRTKEIVSVTLDFLERFLEAQRRKKLSQGMLAIRRHSLRAVGSLALHRLFVRVRRGHCTVGFDSVHRFAIKRFAVQQMGRLERLLYRPGFLAIQGKWIASRQKRTARLAYASRLLGKSLVSFRIFSLQRKIYRRKCLILGLRHSWNLLVEAKKTKNLFLLSVFLDRLATPKLQAAQSQFWDRLKVVVLAKRNALLLKRQVFGHLVRTLIFSRLILNLEHFLRAKMILQVFQALRSRQALLASLGLTPRRPFPI